MVRSLDSSQSLTEDSPEQLEGAVGYQNIDPPGDYSLHRLMMNPQDQDANEIVENNNVDENSNDHQFPQYAEYHEQFQQHRYVADNEPNGPVQNEPTRNQRQRQIIDFDQPYRPENYSYARRLSESRNHRRNLSEDLSLLNLQPLPPQGDIQDSSCHPRLYERLLPRRHCPSQQEVQTQAQELLYNFTLEEFREQRIPTPDDLSVTSGFSDPTWALTGRELRNLADAFSRSQERNIVRRKAQTVSMESINIHDFFHLCSELFHGQGGITQERIVVLFTFISDVAIQQVKLKAERFLKQLMTWSLNFIYDRICSWVQQAGGWNVVLCHSANLIYKWTIFALAAVSIVALGIYIKKSFKEL